MVCQQCMMNTQEGNYYIFHFGNPIGKKRVGSLRQGAIITTYRMGGSEQMFLCNNCVFGYTMQKRASTFRKWAIFIATLAIVMVIIAIVSQLNSESRSAEIFLLATVCTLAFAASIFLMGRTEKKRAANNDFWSLSAQSKIEKGSSLAILIRTAALKAQGFQVFFTPRKIQQLQRTSTFSK